MTICWFTLQHRRKLAPSSIKWPKRPKRQPWCRFFFTHITRLVPEKTEEKQFFLNVNKFRLQFPTVLVVNDALISFPFPTVFSVTEQCRLVISWLLREFDDSMTLLLSFYICRIKHIFHKYFSDSWKKASLNQKLTG